MEWNGMEGKQTDKHSEMIYYHRFAAAAAAAALLILERFRDDAVSACERLTCQSPRTVTSDDRKWRPRSGTLPHSSDRLLIQLGCDLLKSSNDSGFRLVSTWHESLLACKEEKTDFFFFFLGS